MLRKELLGNQELTACDEAREPIFESDDIFHHRQKIHSGLG